MKKVILDYDEITGNLFDKTGTIVGIFYGLVADDVNSEVKFDNSKVDSAIIYELVTKSGLPIDEVIRLKEKGLI